MDLSNMLISDGSTIRDALELINQNGQGCGFVVNQENQMIGLVTDGDVRRYLLTSPQLNSSIIECMVSDFIFAWDTEPHDLTIKKLNSKVHIIPILGERREVVNYISRKNKLFIPISEPTLGRKEVEYVSDCLASGWISSSGEYIKRFENEFSQIHEGRNALAVSNGTVAIHLALVALGIGPGDEVIVPSLTFAASAAAIVHAGACPVFADCDEKLCIDPEHLDELVTEKTKAIIIVHLYGRMAQMCELVEFAETNNLLVIEDAAEALGSRYKDRKAGVLGDAATFSFFGNKTITTGEGGMILFKSEEIYERASILRDHGMSKTKRYWHDFIGYNYRMTNIQAAIGLAQLQGLDNILKQKRTIFNFYKNLFQSHKLITYYSDETDEEFNSNWLYTIVLDKRININELILLLQNDGIDTRRVFYPLHSMPPYQKFKYANKITQSIHANNHGLCLPSSANLTEQDLDRIGSAVLNALDKLENN